MAINTAKPKTMETSLPPVQISCIAGRYLVFRPEAVSYLRRHANSNGSLVGTTPQQPSQNIFLSLPIELRPEEAESLVQQGAAYIVDTVAAHHAALRTVDSNATHAYIFTLRQRTSAARKLLSERSAERSARVAKRLGRSVESSTTSSEPGSVSSPNTNGSNLGSLEPRPASCQPMSLGITLTSSCDLISQEAGSELQLSAPTQRPLCRFLQSTGYYMTPGLRFGAMYSVYPGDPLRYHAHYMANNYDWDEEIPILDIIGGGRLATAVKKAYLLGGQQQGTDLAQEGATRTFSIEWASM